jgi:hypothetical protein
MDTRKANAYEALPLRIPGSVRLAQSERQIDTNCQDVPVTRTSILSQPMAKLLGQRRQVPPSGQRGPAIRRRPVELRPQRPPWLFSTIIATGTY